MSTLFARITKGDRADEIRPKASMSEAELIERLRAHFAREDHAAAGDAFEPAAPDYADEGMEARLSAIVSAMSEALRSAQLRVEMIEAKAELAERRFTEVENKLREATARWQAAEQRAARAEKFLAKFHAMIGGMLSDKETTARPVQVGLEEGRNVNR
ncbi:hypothetical protein [Salinarimonas rosea]|uniref:hypothetical protein n=1 Tax=Salinarimonas rosea TaxID=552063 RepID=UPI00048E2C37|nr:hypothetical protein [Salinarimonas rosea]